MIEDDRDSRDFHFQNVKRAPEQSVNCNICLRWVIGLCCWRSVGSGLCGRSGASEQGCYASRLIQAKARRSSRWTAGHRRGQEHSSPHPSRERCLQGHHSPDTRTGRFAFPQGLGFSHDLLSVQRQLKERKESDDFSKDYSILLRKSFIHMARLTD